MAQRFSQMLKRYRKIKGYRQDALAHAWDYSLETISAWEREKRQPGSQEIPRLARLLGIPVEQLVESLTPQEDAGQKQYAAAKEAIMGQNHLAQQDELLGVYQNRMEFYRNNPPAELFEQAQEIIAVGISLNTIAMQYPREKIVELVTQKQCNLTLCFLDPHGIHCAVREKEEQHKDGRLRELIQLNIENIEATLEDIPLENRHRLQLLTYDSPSRFNIYLINNSFLTIQFYMYARGEDTPLYVYQRKKPHGIFEFYASAARHVINQAKKLQQEYQEYKEDL